MILIVGGRGQGKREYALHGLSVGTEAIGLTPESDMLIFDHLETWLREETDPMPKLDTLLERCPHIVILCDEVGCGVVPLAAEDRGWRERVGRTCCTLAARADAVVRMTCGIPTVLKGELPWNL